MWRSAGCCSRSHMLWCPHATVFAFVARTTGNMLTALSRRVKIAYTSVVLVFGNTLTMWGVTAHMISSRGSSAASVRSASVICMGAEGCV